MAKFNAEFLIRTWPVCIAFMAQADT